MAKVQVQAVGGDIKQMDASTPQEILNKLGLSNYQASVNGEPVELDYDLSDYEFVSLAPRVKGA